MIFINLLSFFGFSFILARLLSDKENTNPFLTFCILGIFLYVTAYLGILALASDTISLVGIIYFVFFFYKKKKDKCLLSFIKIPQNQFIFFAILLLFFITRAEYFSYFNSVDDYSHWGRATYLYWSKKEFLNSQDPIWFMDYPPGIALLNSFFLGNSIFSINNAMFVQGLLIIFTIYRLLSISNKGSNKLFFLNILFYFSMIFIFGGGLHSLSVDLLIGFIFGALIIEYLNSSENSNNFLKNLNFLIPLLFLPLVKQVGLFFSGLLILIFGIHAIFKKRLFLFVALSATLILILLIFASWDEVVSSSNAPRAFNTHSLSISSIFNLFDPTLRTEREQLTIDNFFRVPYDSLLHFHLSPYYWMTVTILFYKFIFYTKNINNLGSFNLKYFTFWLPAGMILYSFFLLLLYLFIFGAYEGIGLASFGRYLSSYYIGMLISIFFIIQYVNVEKHKKLFNNFIILIALVAIPQIHNQINFLLKTTGIIIKDENVKRTLFFASFVNSHTSTKDFIYYLKQRSDGTENTIFNYGIMPRNSNRACWSIGVPYSKSDVWTCNLNHSDILKELLKYNYIFVDTSDDNLNRVFIKFFGVKLNSGDLLKIVKQGNHLKFQFVANISI